MSKIALIDGSGFIFRAFHALPPLTTTSGIQTNAVYGFVRMVLSLIDNLKVDYLAVAFDSARKNFRNDIYSEYKANRPQLPEELVQQFSLIREATIALNLPSLEKENFEADDIIATYATLAEQKGFEVVIISSDKDLMQLIKSPNVYMYDPVKKKYIKETEVITKFGVPPSQLIYAQALIGDSTDNIPGIKGLGPKTAAKLIKQYHTLENIYNNIDKITRPSLKEKLLENKTNAFISLELVVLKKDVPLIIPVENLNIKSINPYLLYEFCNKLEFKSLSTNIAKKYNVDPKKLTDKTSELQSTEYKKAKDIEPNASSKLLRNYTYKVINNNSQLKSLYETLQYATNLYCNLYENIFAILDDSTTVYLIIINKQEQLISLFTEQLIPFSNINIKDFKKYIEPLLLNSGINKVVYNLKTFIRLLKQYDILDLNSYNDIHIMSYVLDGSTTSNSLEELCKTHLLCELTDIEKDLTLTLPDQFLKNLLQSTLCIKYLYNTFKKRIIFEKSTYIYEVVDKPLVKVLYHIEQKGVLINPEVLSEIDKEITIELSKLEQEVFTLSGEPFNLNSPKQVGEILYNKMKIKGKKNKSGSWKTDAYFLEELDNQGIYIAKLILNWRKLCKLKNTYINILPSYISQKDGRIHTTFLQTSTNTGRISSIDPNLQNIPIKTTIGKKIRKAFIASPNYKIISLDYSQIELRLLAHIANVKSLIDSFSKNEDIHKRTAKEIFNLNIEEVTEEYRRKAKTINFGIIYGISEFGLSKRLQLDRQESKIYIENYFKKYPEILVYMEKAKEEARKYSYVTTEFGRKCYISGINSSNHTLKTFAERAAINAKLQGSAADIIRLCMSSIFNYLKETCKSSHILLQIHDELIIEAPAKKAKELAKKIASIMENIVSLKVPLVVNHAIGDNWLEVH